MKLRALISVVLVQGVVVADHAFAQSSGPSSSAGAASSEAEFLPAFPTAQGYGAVSRGGRRGRVIKVTNLDDSGPGSLRAAIEAKGPRNVIFEVGGIIRLKSDLSIRNPFVTIAGQTAPGEGICIRDATLHLRTHNIILRHFCARLGDELAEDPGTADAVSFLGAAKSIVDHASVSWGIDENIGFNNARTKDITVQWSIISEALTHSLHPKGSHGMGVLVSRARNVSIHHNLFAHNDRRNIEVNHGGHVEFVNNVIYNWGRMATRASGRTSNVLFTGLGNFYKPGPSDRSPALINFAKGNPTAHMFAAGNITADGRPVEPFIAFSVSATSAPAVPLFNIKVDPPETIYNAILENAGATVPARDSVDRRIVDSVRNGTGKLIDSPGEVGGYPSYRQGEPPRDSDGDGIPDKWETAQGLDPQNPGDGRADWNGAGYTNLEYYLNTLAGDYATAPKLTKP